MYIVFDLWLIFAFFSSLPMLMVTAWVYYAFAAMTIIPPELSGGINLPVTTIAFMAVVARVVLDSKFSLMRSFIFDARALGLLAAYTIVAVAGAVLLPRLMTHILVYPMNGAANGGTDYVTPTSANITQALYIVVSSATALAYALIASRQALLGNLRTCFLYGAAVLVATGLADMVFGAAGQSDLLDVFRLAQYAYLVDVEVVNVRRVVGLMPEASSFGGTCVFWCATLLFTRDFFPHRQRLFFVMPLVLATAVLALLSTSTTAYLGLFVTAVVFALDTLWRILAGSLRQRLHAATQLAAAVLFGVAIVTYVVLDPTLSASVWSVFESVVLDKGYSSSFEERSAWTAAGLDAFWSSLGLGIGVGSVRTSNLFVNILASTGILGAVLLGCFLLVFFAVRPARKDSLGRALVRGLKLATLPMFAGAAVAGTTPDFGPLLGASFGLVVGVASLRRAAHETSEQPRHSIAGQKLMPNTKVVR